MKSIYDFEEIPNSIFEDLRIKFLLEAVEDKNITKAREKQKFVDDMENLIYTVNKNFVIQYDFIAEDEFQISIFRKFIK